VDLLELAYLEESVKEKARKYHSSHWGYRNFKILPKAIIERKCILIYL